MRKISRLPFTKFLLTSLLFLTVVSLPALGSDSKITVMTRNIYLGADLSRVLAATTFPEFVAAVSATFAQVQATNFPERAEALADEIKKRKPVLIGLQEVALWRSQFPSNLATPATTVEYDFLELLLDAVADRGLDYQAAVVGIRADIEAPGITPQGLKDFRMTIRDVILVRTDSHEKDLELSNAVQNNFVTNLVLNTLVGPIRFIRGWASVDVSIDETMFRFINTHLEAFAEPVRFAQAGEILAGPANTELPVILLGDFNAAPGTPTYARLADAGFIDAAVEEGEEGFTCCQDADLRNPVSDLTVRIDDVLFRGDVSSKDVRRVGHREKDRTDSGLWPSDHAGVVAKLEIGDTDDDDDEEEDD